MTPSSSSLKNINNFSSAVAGTSQHGAIDFLMRICYTIHSTVKIVLSIFSCFKECFLADNSLNLWLLPAGKQLKSNSRENEDTKHPRRGDNRGNVGAGGLRDHGWSREDYS